MINLLRITLIPANGLDKLTWANEALPCAHTRTHIPTLKRRSCSATPVGDVLGRRTSLYNGPGPPPPPVCASAASRIRSVACYTCGVSSHAAHIRLRSIDDTGMRPASLSLGFLSPPPMHHPLTPGRQAVTQRFGEKRTSRTGMSTKLLAAAADRGTRHREEMATTPTQPAPGAG